MLERFLVQLGQLRKSLCHVCLTEQDLYSSVFAGGFAAGWTGGRAAKCLHVCSCGVVGRYACCMMLAWGRTNHTSATGLACVPPSCPQFIVMGPLFHFLKDMGIELSDRGITANCW